MSDPLTTPDDNSPWRCPECGKLAKACECDNYGDYDNAELYDPEDDGEP